MVVYFLLFTFIGFIVTLLSSSHENRTFLIFVVIAVLWGIAAGFIWGLVAFGEMFVGYFIYKTFIKSNSDSS